MTIGDDIVHNAFVLQVARVIVKFVPGLQLPQTEAAEAQHAAGHGAAWQTLQAKFPGVTLQPFFTMIDAAKLESIERRAAAASIPSPQLASYFAILVPRGVAATEVETEVAAWPHVEFAYVEGRPGPPPSVNAADDPLSANQGYLLAAPTGIDAHFAWAEADGSGIGFVDLEQGWTLDHEDLPKSIPMIGPGSFFPDKFQIWINHGTSVLGIIAGVDNDKGIVGIAPHTSVRVVSQWFEPPGQEPFFGTAIAIALAIAEMQKGDVLLIETTAPPAPKFGWVPAEVDPLVFALIQTATGLGITVLEPAGNNLEKPGVRDIGGSNLDAFTTNGGKFVLNRASPDFKDSGAIIVGAATSTVQHERLLFSNYGSRVDCYAWGQSITTCGMVLNVPNSGSSLQTFYTEYFGGTSGATAIVAGAAVLLQSWALTWFGSVLNPTVLRALLSDQGLNTASKTPLNDRIGVMPNLRHIIQHLKSLKYSTRWDAIISILFGGVIYGGGGWSWTPGSPPQPVPPRNEKLPFQFDAMPDEKRDLVIGLALLELTGLVNDPAQRKTIQRSTIGLMRSAIDKIATGMDES